MKTQDYQIDLVSKMSIKELYNTLEMYKNSKDETDRQLLKVVKEELDRRLSINLKG